MTVEYVPVGVRAVNATLKAVREAAAFAATHNAREVESATVCARDLVFRVQTVAGRLTRALNNDDVFGAAAAAGQMSALTRMAEAYLRSAADRRGAMGDALDRVLRAMPPGMSERELRRREQQSARTKAKKAAARKQK
jgi:hypothetical protein